MYTFSSVFESGSVLKMSFWATDRRTLHTKEDSIKNRISGMKREIPWITRTAQDVQTIEEETS